jgi:hypothetical protein
MFRNGIDLKLQQLLKRQGGELFGLGCRGLCGREREATTQH